jgi:hypothetical protein
MRATVPLRFYDPAYEAGLPLHSLQLSYSIRAINLSQRRFQDKLIAEPSVNLSSYEFDAVFTWIEIYLAPQSYFTTTNLYRYLMKQNGNFGAFRGCHVTSLSSKDPARGHAFKVRFQDPNPEGLRLFLTAFLGRHCQPGSSIFDVSLTGMEVSIDIYPRRRLRTEKECIIDRMIMTELIRKHLSVCDAFREGRRRPRFVYDKQGALETQPLIALADASAAWINTEARRSGWTSMDFAARHPEAHHQPFIDSTFNFGEQGERLHYRCIDKITDNRSGAGALPLPPAAQRSRLELTLIDEAPGDGLGPASIGIKTLFDIDNRGVRWLNALLVFDAPVFARNPNNPASPDPDEWLIFSRSGVAGLAHKVDADILFDGEPWALRALKRRKGLSSGSLPRYQDFNHKVKRGLERLEKRWRKGWRKAALSDATNST